MAARARCSRHDHRHHDRPPERVDALDWSALRARLDDAGFALTEPLLDAGECEQLAVGMRHGVSTVTRGSRTALGIIFHDAR